MLQVADAAGTEVERRWAEPFRRYKIWKEVRACSAALCRALVPLNVAEEITVFVVIFEAGTCRGEAREMWVACVQCWSQAALHMP